MKNNFFYKKSKADVLKYLSNIKGSFFIPKTFSFTVNEWKKSKNKIYLELKKNFYNSKVAIRSSSREEDKIQESGAGKYVSVLNVKLFDKKNFFIGVNDVIRSYSKKNLLTIQK